jgi:transcription initiation factor TFIID subunit TAF12
VARKEERAGVFRLHRLPEAEEKTQKVAKQQEQQQQQQQQQARQERNKRPALLQKHQDLAIIASAAVPEALNRDSRSVLRRIFREHEQNGVVDQSATDAVSG